MSKVQVYNTLSRQKEDFVPLDPSNVRMYVCGPTVYDYVHIGNARPFVIFDTLYRLLKRHYPRVTYARNITDVEDKIIARATQNGETIEALTQRTTEVFHKDIAGLNTLMPDHEPKATAYIGQMISLCETLIAKGHAYANEGHVLFHVPSMPDYGKLSRRSRDELIAGARVEVAPYKKDPADFVLWKPSHENEVGWSSPWGHGRPGWHIECSAMAGDLLGETFDIHCGGLDLIFPHHENEIAQSSCAHNGAALAKYWMHNGFLTVNGEKMSKSLGNFFTIHELLDDAPGEALRFLLLSAHYRQPQDFTREGLRQSKTMLDRWYNSLRQVKALPRDSQAVPEAVESALCDDLNTPLAIAHLHDLFADLNRATDDTVKARLKAEVLSAGEALGILQQDPDQWLKGATGASTLDEAFIEKAIHERKEAKKAKNFALADTIRDDLAAQGIVLEDALTGTTWRRT